jgi:hypothetical protein
MPKQLLFLLLSCMIGATSFSQQPDYSGTWILNLEKSKLEDPSEGFTGSKFIIKQQGEQFSLTRYHFYGKKQNRLKFNMVADGKPRAVKMIFKGVLEWQGETLKATLSRKKNFLNIVNYTFGETTDEFIADEVFTGLPKNHHNIWVFDREK